MWVPYPPKKKEVSRRMTRYNIVERAIDFWSSWKFSSMESIKNVIQQSIWQISYKYKIIKWYNITQAIKIIKKKGKIHMKFVFVFVFMRSIWAQQDDFHTPKG